MTLLPSNNLDIHLPNRVSFTQAGLHPYLSRSFGSLGFTFPTPVQFHALSTYLNDPSVSIIAQSKSGTGKTNAYLNIIFEYLIKVTELEHRCYVLVLVPTRELAIQVYQNVKNIEESFKKTTSIDEVQRLVRRRCTSIRTMLAIGGMPFEDDRRRVRDGAHILVGTIGRVVELMQKQVIQQKMEWLVLDQADKLFQSNNKSFIDIFDRLSTLLKEGELNRYATQLLMFSATYNRELLVKLALTRKYTYIQTLSQDGKLNLKVTSDLKQFCPQSSTEEPAQSDALQMGNVKKYCLKSKELNSSNLARKIASLKQILQEVFYCRCLIFVEKKALLEQINERLIQEGLETLLIHGSLSQSARIKLMNQANHSKIIISSDLLARGIDLRIDLVVLFDAKRNDTFWHRIGRTGRYGRNGVVISLDPIPDWQAYNADRIQEDLNEINSVEPDHKEWYGCYLTEVGQWQPVEPVQQISNNAAYRFYVQQQCPPEESHNNDEDGNEQFESREAFEAYVRKLLRCSECMSFLEQMEAISKHRFKLREYL